MAAKRRQTFTDPTDTPKLIHESLEKLSENIHALAQAQLEVAHHQRITNLIVLSQIITDPDEQKRLRAEAVSRMNTRRLQ